MTTIITYTKDDIFKESVRKMVSNATKSGKVEDKLQIQAITDQRNKIIWCAENKGCNLNSIWIYLIDINQHYKEDAITLAREIRNLNPLAYIVFVSTGNCNAHELLNHSIKASDFFLKPMGTYEFVELINEIIYDNSQLSRIQTEQNTEGFIDVVSGHKEVRIALSDILAIEYEKPRSVIVTTYGRIKVNSSMQELLEKLTISDINGTMVKTHQSFIVNLANAEIVDLKNLEVVVKKGYKIPIARTRKNIVKDAMQTSIEKNLVMSTKLIVK